jgi:hypothetical protein
MEPIASCRLRQLIFPIGHVSQEERFHVFMLLEDFTHDRKRHAPAASANLHDHLICRGFHADDGRDTDYAINTDCPDLDGSAIAHDLDERCHPGIEKINVLRCSIGVGQHGAARKWYRLDVFR